MRSQMCRFGLVVVLLLGAANADGPKLFAQAADPLLGTWALDRGKSTFSGAAPDKRIMKFERAADSLRHVTETTNLSGFAEDIYRLQYTFKIDGKDYPADPQMPVNVVSFKRLDANTIERSGKYRGEVVETVTYQVSSDGKTLTLTQKGMLNGAEVSSVQVFNRQ